MSLANEKSAFQDRLQDEIIEFATYYDSTFVLTCFKNHREKKVTEVICQLTLKTY